MRQEFSKATKRAALERSRGYCEAGGPLYGFIYAGEKHRCLSFLYKGVEFDHVLACSNGGDNSLENCLAVCPRCHAWKTQKLDTPRAAKSLRQQDKHHGIKRLSRPLAGSKASGIRKRMNGNVERWS